MSHRRLARRYVVPLGELAQECQLFDVVTQDLITVGELTRESAEFKYSISQANGSKDLQERVLRQLVAGRVQTLTWHFLLLLVQKRRLAYLPDIVAEMQAYADEINQVLPVTVTTAVPLAHEQQGEVSEQLAQRLGHRVRLQCVTNPDLLGGMIIRVGDRVYDGSVAGKLQHLLRKMNPTYNRQMPLVLSPTPPPQDSATDQVVTVITAVPLTADAQDALKGQLEAKLGSGVKLLVETRAEILGGMIIQAGDKVVDGSIAGRLQRLLSEFNPLHQDELLTLTQPLTSTEAAKRVITVTTAVPLEGDLAEALKHQLQQRFGEAEIQFKLQPQLLGGVKVQVGNKVYDDSVVYRLHEVFAAMDASKK